MSCCVCESPLVDLFLEVEEKTYWQCKDCMVIFLDPKFRLSPSEEKYRYQQHNNGIYDEKYRLFLSKLYKPLRARLEEGSRGLDFGCGPGPALAEMLKEDGFYMDLYDPFFFKEILVFSKTYDFITCTEVIEHFFEPAKEFKRLDKMLSKGGLLGVMTVFLDDEKDFGEWYYRKDPTHVVFYQPKTFEVIASIMGWSYEIPEKDVILFKK